jgi:hypothetical protein
MSLGTEIQNKDALRMQSRAVLISVLNAGKDFVIQLLNSPNVFIQASQHSIALALTDSMTTEVNSALFLLEAQKQHA